MHNITLHFCALSYCGNNCSTGCCSSQLLLIYSSKFQTMKSTFCLMLSIMHSRIANMQHLYVY